MKAPCKSIDQSRWPAMSSDFKSVTFFYQITFNNKSQPVYYGFITLDILENGRNYFEQKCRSTF